MASDRNYCGKPGKCKLTIVASMVGDINDTFCVHRRASFCILRVSNAVDLVFLKRVSNLPLW